MDVACASDIIMLSVGGGGVIRLTQRWASVIA